jgi:hypothetical protein
MSFVMLILGGFVTVAHTYFQEKRVLHGLIAIRSYCHKVRIDDTAWTRIEKFVSAHSLADFTHGVCPSCFQKVTSDLTRDRSSESKKW